MATLTVGTGQTYATIAAAVAASSAGDTVNVVAGTYTNDFITVNRNLTIQAVGGAVKLVATVAPPNGKAIIDEGGAGVTVTLNGLTLSGAVVGDGNGAGVRYEGGTLVMNNDTVTGNQEGLLGAADANGSITINNSTFTANGTGTGYVHNIYVGAINQLTVTNSTITNAIGGHDIKSRAATNVITGNTITDGASGTASYEIDIANGGVATISNNTIQKGVNASNPIAISYGEEGSGASNSLTVSNNLMVDDYTAHVSVAVRNALAGTTASITGNTLYGWQTVASGAATVSGNTVPSTEPALTSPSAGKVATGLPPLKLAPEATFDPAFYLARNPDVAAAGIDPYTHFHNWGWREGRNPNALFDTKYYEANNPDVAKAQIDPLLHFSNYGWTEGRSPDALFDTKYYLAQNPDVAAAHINPLQHYDLWGWKEGRNPSAAFSTNAYLAANPDVKAAGLDPLAQYLANGAAEGRVIYAVK